MATILWCILNVLTELLILYLSCSFIEGLVSTIDITVEGDNVLKSGVRQYSLYKWNAEPFTIKCALNTAVQPNEVRLLNEQGRDQDLTTNRRSTRFTSEWSKRINNRYSRRGSRDKYTCVALFTVSSRPIVNGSRCYSAIYSDVEIEYVSTERFARINVGSSLYGGEQISIDSKDYSSVRGKKCERLPDKNSSTIMYIPYGYGNRRRTSIDYDCGYYYKQCSSYYYYLCAYYRLVTCGNVNIVVDILPHLELFLTPSNFSSNATAMQFNCTSVPARMMYWIVITTNGYILDFNSLDDVIKASMNVTIKQRPGETILSINDTSPGGNGIQMVMCSSYDTLARVVVTSHRMVTDKNIDLDIGPTSTPQTTLMDQQLTTTTECNSNPQSGAKHTVAIDSHPDDPHESYEYGKEDKEVRQSKPFAESTYVNLLVIVIATLAAIVCGLAIVVVVMCRKNSGTAIHVAPSPRDADAGRQGAETEETVLHDNPIYSSYSDKADAVYFPTNKEENDSCMYINI